MTTKFEMATNYTELQPYVVTVEVPSPGWGEAPWSISGLMDTNLTVAGGASWTEDDGTSEGNSRAAMGAMADSAMGSIKSGIESVNNRIAGSMGKFGGGVYKGVTNAIGSGVAAGSGGYVGQAKMAAGTFNTGLATTFKKYVSSNLSSFTINMHVFPDVHGSFQEIAEKVYKFALPKIGFAGGTGGAVSQAGRSMVSYLYDDSMLRARWENADYFDSILCHVTIGRWFRASGLYCTNASIQFSQHMDDEGKPLYGIVQLTFETHRMYDAKEVAAWFNFSEATTSSGSSRNSSYIAGGALNEGNKGAGYSLTPGWLK